LSPELNQQTMNQSLPGKEEPQPIARGEDFEVGTDGVVDD